MQKGGHTCSIQDTFRCMITTNKEPVKWKACQDDSEGNERAFWICGDWSDNQVKWGQQHANGYQYKYLREKTEIIRMVPRKSKTFKVCSVLFCSLTKGVKSLNNDGKRTKVFKAQMVHSSWHLTQTCLSNMKWATSIVTCISPGWDAIPLQVTP